MQKSHITTNQRGRKYSPIVDQNNDVVIVQRIPVSTWDICSEHKIKIKPAGHLSYFISDIFLTCENSPDLTE